MRAAPLTLPRLSRADARDACARAAPRGALPLPETGWSVAIDAARANRCGPAATAVDVTWGEHALRVWCPGEPLDAALNRFEPGLAAAGRPSDVAALLIEAALLPAIAGAERATGRDLRVTGAERIDGPVPEGRLALRLDDGERSWGLRVEASGEAVADLLSAWPLAPRALDGLPIPAAVRIGTTRLTLGAVRSLRPGDAVLLEVDGGEGVMLVVAEAWLAEAGRGDGHWKLDGGLRPARSRNDVEWTMRDDEGVAEAGGAIERADDLPVRLMFDVGRLDATLGELRRLDVGSILELGREAGDLVRISANGKLIGQGALVEVEGKVAVRVVRMFDHG